MFVNLNPPVIASNEFVAVGAQLLIGNARFVDTSTRYIPPGCPVPLSTSVEPESVGAVNIHNGARTAFVEKVTVPNLSGR